MSPVPYLHGHLDALSGGIRHRRTDRARARRAASARLQIPRGRGAGGCLASGGLPRKPLGHGLGRAVAPGVRGRHGGGGGRRAALQRGA